MDNPEPRAQYLSLVLRQIERTTLRIPRFQRHFVWDERDVVNLLESIQRGYPIGSVLTWRVEASDRYFSGFRKDPFPEADDLLDNFEVILDGAQRLSTLYGCLRNPSSSGIYQIYYDLRSNTFVHHSSLRVAEVWHVPMGSLFDSRAFLKVQGVLAEVDGDGDLLQKALDLFTTFQNYQIPIISISGAELDDVVEVFRRVNSSGTSLSSVDFVRALTWRSSFDLEETFESLSDRYSATALEGVSEEFLTRCLAITSGLSLDAREVIQLKDLSARPGGLEEEISLLQLALDRMVNILGELHVVKLDEIPYEVQRLLTFAMALYAPEVNHDVIKRWFWMSTFAEEHQGKPESYISRSVRNLRDLGDPSLALEVRREVDPYLLAIRARRGKSAIAAGFDLLLRQEGARSLLSGRELNRSSIFHGKLFSSGEIGNFEGAPANPGSLLANIVLLDQEDAREWRRLPPLTSLADVFSMTQEQSGDALSVWNSQGLPTNFNGLDPVEYLRTRSVTLLSRVIPIEVEYSEY